MGLLGGSVGASGKLKTKLIRNGIDAPLSWKIRNWMRWRFIWNFITWHLAHGFTKLTGVVTTVGRLHARLIHADGTYVDYGWVAYGLVTTAWVNFLVASLQASDVTFADLKWHDSGIGVTAAAIGDTDIETTDGAARDTDSQGGATNVYNSVGTIPYTGAYAITEHGIFTVVTGGTLGDRHVFGAINVVNTDSIQFTYEMTYPAGG